MGKKKNLEPKIDMISACENIARLTKYSQLSEQTLTEIDPYTDYLSKELDLTKMQTVWLALILELNYKNTVDQDRIIDYLNCNHISMLRYKKDFDQLTDRKFLIQEEDRGRRRYRVPSQVIEALVNKKKPDLDQIAAKLFKKESDLNVSIKKDDEKKGKVDKKEDSDSEEEEKVVLYQMIKHSSIIERDMFYNKDFKQDLDRLACALSEDKYKIVRQKLIEKKMQPSFTCIFYGAPGTGKTETVKQLAFQTKRDIMKVDLSEIRSKWIGESEKRMKAIFDEYQKALENSSTTPILLFNEADGIFGRRTETYTFAEKSENTLQNIILEGMENLKGILIATTNLIDNLDSAMDRRFLFKLYFPKPDEETRRQLFKSIIPEVSDKTIKTLAKRYELSGGHIQNVGKRLTIDTVLYGEKVTTLEALDNYCRQEEFQYGSHP